MLEKQHEDLAKYEILYDQQLEANEALTKIDAI
jgi:hypothetical protein